MKIDSFRPRRRDSGFTLIELMIVVAIMLVISAMATPRLLNTIDDIRIRSSMRDVIGLMQQSRQRGVRDNRFYGLNMAGQLVYADLNGDGVFQSGGVAPNPQPEPAIQLPSTITLTAAGAPAFDNTVVGPNFNPQATNVRPYFNARGLPCVVVGGVCNSRTGAAVGGQSGANVGFLYFYSQTRTLGPLGWGAISVSPAGRIKAWFYDARTGVWGD